MTGAWYTYRIVAKRLWYMSKEEKYKQWDRIFGFGPDQFKFKEWKSKDGSIKYLKDCPCEQISDPDIPF